MKCRLGFVSNSSTTAFFFLTTKENHDRVLEKMTPYERAVIKQVTSAFSLCGVEMVQHFDLSTEGGSYCFTDFWLNDDSVQAPEDHDEALPQEVFYRYKALAEEKPEQVKSWREG
jgi:hypothetical protein